MKKVPKIYLVFYKFSHRTIPVNSRKFVSTTYEHNLLKHLNWENEDIVMYLSICI